jgi:hypothetical protein
MSDLPYELIMVNLEDRPNSADLVCPNNPDWLTLSQKEKELWLAGFRWGVDANAEDGTVSF